jgi:aminoglycoside phosphotransferase family enzyme/predicted kinase
MGGSEPYAGAVETHCGVVLFIGDRAYKLKKPVAFPFVDFSTVAARQRACEAEVALNRRLAPDAYLGVGALVDPDRDASEPLVVMHRFPVARRLSTLVATGVDVGEELQSIARAVAAFHAAAPVTQAARQAASPAATLGRWEANAAEMAPAVAPLPDPTRSDAVLHAARRYLAGRGALLERRIEAGWARDGHGDLLADDIFCLDAGPQVLDCLEFDERLRVGDVLADVAFLAMDLERLGRGDLGWMFLEQHRELLGDHWPVSLAHHHIAYRAQVRAKVACLRAQHGDATAAHEAATLLGLAARHLEAGRIRLVVVGGSPGTGKSTLAANLGARLGAVVLRSDEVRKELAGLPTSAHAPAPLDAAIYGASCTAATYETLIERGRELLGLGESVILDASWQEPAWRAAARTVASRASADLAELQCTAPLALALERVERRAAEGSDPSDADERVTDSIAARFAPWPESVEVDTTGTSTETAAKALAAIGAP